MTQHTVNAHSVDPATVTQAHAERVAAALGLAGADLVSGPQWIPRHGWLTISAQPILPFDPRTVSVPWSLVAELGDDTERLREAVEFVAFKLEGIRPLDENARRFAVEDLRAAIRDSRTLNEAGHG
jgi:hypothetical protein